MPSRHVLTFNWHDPYLHMFSQTGFQISVGDWMSRADGTSGWDYEKRPLPENITLLKKPEEAIHLMRSGQCDAVICHTLQDMAFVAPFDVPTVYLTHNALQNDGMNDQKTMDQLREEIGNFLQARNGVFAAISPMKLASWDMDGFVVRPGINLDDYAGYEGDEGVALAVGNLFPERDHMLGFRYLQEILNGVPNCLVGENPNLPEAQKAENWDDLKGYFRTCRVYVNTTVEEFEDGYNLGMLEAMATGMPVVCLDNVSSPIVDGENGFVSADTGYLQDRVKALLDDHELAKKLGAQARETVAEKFSVDAFVKNWHEIVEASIQKHAEGNGANMTNEVMLDVQQDDLFPFVWADVAAFLTVDDLNDIAVAKLKIDRVGTGFLCDVCLGNKITKQTMVWQGLEAHGDGRVVWPAYLNALDAGIRGVIEGAVVSGVSEAQKSNGAQSFHVNLGGADEFVFRVGEDRVTPGDARSDIYLHHAKRYVFARQFCVGKRVVDLGSGTGYGAKILSRDAQLVVGVDLSDEAQTFANSAFGSDNIQRIAGDIRQVGLGDGQFDTVVCFEAMEHVREHDAFLDEVHRLLKTDGTLVVSTPNKKIYGLPENENKYHVGMLELDEFKALVDRYYEDVEVVGQKRAQAGEPFYSAFDFHKEVSDDDEVFVAVCRKPRENVLPKAESTPTVEVNNREENDQGERRLKILISHVSNPISMGRYYVDAFRQAHDVITCGPVIDADELAQWREAEKQHAFKNMDAAEVEKLNLIERLAEPCDIDMPRGQVDVGEVLNRLPEGWEPDLFMWVDSATGFLPMGLEKLNCPSVCLSVDTHTGQLDWRIQYAKMFDHVYLVHNQYIQNFVDAGCAHVGWLPPACDPNIHGMIPAGKSFDIGFVGQTHRQWHPHRVRLIERLMHAGFDVHVESKILEEMTLFNSRSKVLFNRSLNGDINMRVFESLCSGSMLLTDRLEANARLTELFEDRKHLVFYDEDNLEDLARYYLEHEDEREAIAEAGRKAVLDAHTYGHRCDQIVDEVVGVQGIARCVNTSPTQVVQEASMAGMHSGGTDAPASILRGAGTPESAIEELSRFTGESVAAVKAKLPNAGQALTDEWRSDNRDSEEKVDAFYKETEHFIYDLTHFNYAEMYMGWRGALYNLCQQVSEAMNGFEVLDYGGGIGTTMLELSDLPGVKMTYADLPGTTFDYASWRFQQRGLDVATIALGDDDPLAGKMYDVIVCMEVIEHLVEPEEVVQYLIDHLRPGGLLVITVTFYAPEPDMMHLNIGRYTNEGFYQIVQDMGMEELTKYSPRVFRKGTQKAVTPKPEPTPAPMASVANLVAGQLKKETTSPSVTPVSVAAPQFSDSQKVAAFFEQWQGPVRLNLGCGEDRREGYVNVDAYVQSADLQMDIFNLQMGDDTADEVFSSHMLEHLGKNEVPEVLKEWHRVLKPGGSLRLNLPDLEWAMEQWLRTPEEHRWGWALDTIYGLQTHDGEYHKTGFTVAKAEKLMEEAGFGQVRVSWTWSHGVRCVWVEAVKPAVGELPGVIRDVDIERFEGQFPYELSGLVPYSEQDVSEFLTGDWQIAFVSFERLPMDGASFTMNVAVKKGNEQRVLQGLRIYDVPQNPYLTFPEYMKDISDDARKIIGETIGQALSMKLNDPAYQNSEFLIVPVKDREDLGMDFTGERMIPGRTKYSLYIPHMKRYLLAEKFAEGARVLDAGCGAGYGTKRLAQVATKVDAVDIDPEAIEFAKKTYGDAKITYDVADLRTFEPEDGVYDLVTSFEVIEHLKKDEIAGYLQRLRQAVKMGGTVLISTPNKLVAEQWNNPHHHYEMTKEEFDAELTAVFGDVTLLGQVAWDEQTEVPGQCAISGRVTDEDDMFIAVCTKREVSTLPASEIKPRVSIITPLYNKVEFTEACVKGLDGTRGQSPYEVILVDNGSTDNTAALLDRLDGEVGYHVIRNGENLGFSAGNNIGAKTAKGDYLLFLNNDTVPHSGWLDAMVDVMDNQADVGVVGAKLLYPDTGRIQHAGLEIVNGVPDHVFRHAEANAPEVTVSRDLDMVTGACLMIRTDLFEQLGGFDEGYVNGVEDIDLCLRVRDAGYRVHYCAEAVLDHYEGTSEGRYDHVQPNLERFAQRWNGRFDAQGRFVPVQDSISRGEELLKALSGEADGKAPLRGVWEGTQFVYHSLSLVNMGVTSELIKNGCELKLLPYEPATFGPEVDPERYGPLAERLNADLSGPAQFHVRHKWPPDFSAPPEGHWVMIQPWEFGRIPKDWVKPIQEGVDEVWVPSNFVKDCYVESGIDADQVQVIPNGVRTELLNPDAKPLALDTDKSFKFLFVGGTIFRKGVDVLLNVYRQTFSPEDDVCLVIKGMGDDTFYKGQTAVELVRKLQADPDAPEILYLTDDLTDEEMAGLYTACDCLVHPYRGEGFGMPVAEAMACGLPVIVTQGGACDDFCSDDNAYFVPAKRRAMRLQG